LLQMFRFTFQHALMVPSGTLLTLESRIGRLRRRRRVSLLKQLVAVIGPLMVGMSLVLLMAAGSVIASVR
jgi:hypothetical protein